MRSKSCASRYLSLPVSPLSSPAEEADSGNFVVRGMLGEGKLERGVGGVARESWVEKAADEESDTRHTVAVTERKNGLRGGG